MPLQEPFAFDPAAEYRALLDAVPAGPTRVETVTVPYEHDGVALSGFAAVDAAGTGRRPGVLVVHDWTGLDDYERTRCVLLARLGYVAVGADVYGAGVRPQGPDAPATAGIYYRDPTLLKGRIAAALDVLRGREDVDPDRLAVIGYCFGGHAALSAARDGAAVAGVVSFHGSLQPAAPEEAAAVTAKILVLTGAADPNVPDEAVTAFEDSLRVNPAVDWQVHAYSGAVHAFTVPTANMPGRAEYDERADHRSWVAMQAFLAEIFA